MIYCCGCYQTPFQTVYLLPDYNYKDRKLEIIICPKCGALVAELVQYNILTQKYEKIRPKQKKTAKFINEIKNNVVSSVSLKQGTKERAGFVYGVNKQMKNGSIYQYSVDFNGQKKLVKVIK